MIWLDKYCENYYIGCSTPLSSCMYCSCFVTCCAGPFSSFMWKVCRRYKQYHQQMQMVVSSFETVAGLSSATPYISLALKSVSRHFRSLKNAISDQLKHIRRTLGEDLSSPTTGASSSKVDTSTSRLKYLDQSLQRHKYGGGNVGFLETQHVWRPQRGLPERSVAILRAWLFEHFLHP